MNLTLGRSKFHVIRMVGSGGMRSDNRLAEPAGFNRVGRGQVPPVRNGDMRLEIPEHLTGAKRRERSKAR